MAENVLTNQQNEQKSIHQSRYDANNSTVSDFARYNQSLYDCDTQLTVRVLSLRSSVIHGFVTEP